MENKNKSNILLIIIFAAAFGIGGGAVGGLLARSYVGDSLVTPFFGEIDYSHQGPNLIIRDPKKVVVQQDDRVSNTVSAVQNGLVGIFKKRDPRKADKNFNLDNFYVTGDEVGQGLIITADGWIMTAFKPEAADKYVVVTSNNQVYDIDKILTDQLTSASFIHVDAKDFPVRKFASPADIANGQTVLAVRWDGETELAAISDIKKRTGGLVESSDAFSSKIQLASKLGPDFEGVPIFNLGGDIVGVLDKDDQVDPISHFDSATRSLLKSGEIRRASLGANYIDMSRMAGEIPSGAGAFDFRQNGNYRGALIYKDASGTAVAKGSAAAAAGLKEGDLVLSVNGFDVDQNTGLNDLVQEFQPGERTVIIYLRNGEQKETEVTFK